MVEKPYLAKSNGIKFRNFGCNVSKVSRYIKKILAYSEYKHTEVDILDYYFNSLLAKILGYKGYQNDQKEPQNNDF